VRKRVLRDAFKQSLQLAAFKQRMADWEEAQRGSGAAKGGEDGGGGGGGGGGSEDGGGGRGVRLAALSSSADKGSGARAHSGESGVSPSPRGWPQASESPTTLPSGHSHDLAGLELDVDDDEDVPISSLSPRAGSPPGFVRRTKTRRAAAEGG
jgi:hypothetical protein